MNWWHIYIAAWGGAMALSAVLTAVCRRLAPRWGFMDRPLNEQHKRHRQATPVMGGVAMAVSWVVVIALGLPLSAALRGLLGHAVSLYLPGVQTVLPQLFLLMVGAVAITGLGMVDDRVGLNAAAKLAGQFLVAGGVACWAGVRITAFSNSLFLNWVVTTFWILLIVNALNWFDNMDGLAAGTAVVAAFLFLFVAAIRDQYFVAVLAAVTGGVAAGFLLHNRPPAHIFMGDAGSHFLGYCLAVVGVLTTYYTPSETLTPAPLLIPALVLGLPVFDAAAVVVMRLRRGQPVYIGDTTHLSHRFTDLGLSRPQAVLLAWLLAFAIGSGAVTLLWLPVGGAVIVLLQSLAILTIVTLIQFYAREPKTSTCSTE